ncbi:MAG TPA: hypothetical protein ENH95_06830 [Nitrosopumilus sp.]|nr:hypothetical protein [Nitrosopumilus sp.]
MVGTRIFGNRDFPGIVYQPAGSAFRVVEVDRSGAFLDRAEAKGSKGAISSIWVTTAGDELVADNVDRISVMIQNSGPEVLYIGPTGNTTDLSIFLFPFQWFFDDQSTDSWVGLTTTGSTSVKVLEI